MRNPMKIHIKKRRPFGNDWVRFEIMNKIEIDNYSAIKTEAQLCYFIYKHHGPGRYQLLAWQKGHEGFWMFWLGDIYEQGFIRDVGKNKELEKLKGEFIKAKTYEEKQDVEEEIEFEKEIGKEIKTLTRRGPVGIIKYRPGILHPFQSY